MADDRETWESLDCNPGGLWRHLLRYRLGYAAWGLLVELLAELWHQEHDERPKGHGQTLPDGTPMPVELRNLYRERLMEILGDQDGKQLQAFLDAYDAHRAEHGTMPPALTSGVGLTLFRLVVAARGSGSAWPR